ncbi:MAG: tRNA lysidine(34) synthetase TilS [Syntrophomonadaceae bacterium]|jgi:tRNA(Ile)-lysidine synthase|nr:tRNA lysidine(34) synthetase TilS [Syntrophomonadaceae bacterium]
MLEKVISFVNRNQLINKNDKILLAVSGGPDSMALLHIMQHLKDELDIQIGVAHLNHQLRPEADAEEEYLKNYCQKRIIPFYSRSVDVLLCARQQRKSVEEAGRDLRYQFFMEITNQFNWERLATAHHKDDRAETVLLHLLRGSGVKGLRSIMPVSGYLIRPLLSVTKEEILDFLILHKVKFFIDESNSDFSYLRNRLRHELLPLLKAYNPQIVTALNQLADIAQEENYAMEKENDALWEQLIISDEADKIVLDNKKLLQVLPAYQRRLVQKALGKLKGESGWSLQIIDYVLDLAKKTGAAKQINLPQKVLVRREYDKLIFSMNQQNKIKFLYEITIPGSLTIEETGETYSFKIEAKENFQPTNGETYFDYDKMKQPLFLRSRKKGDRFEPSNMQGTKKIKDYFIDIKLPIEERDLVPVLASDQEIYGLLGYRSAKKAIVDSNTQNILVIKKAASS